jgi:hypothetical protein
MAAESLGLERFVDANARGGRNALYCYGYKQGIGLSGNIMGAGDSFTTDDALPWLWAIMMMQNRPFDIGWRATTTDPGPASWRTLKAG